jgi:hypothetical protein
MKNIFYPFSVLVGLLVLAASCQKEVSDRTANLPATLPTNQDLGAGSWQTVLLSRPDSFVVNAPVLTTSPLYIADLFEIKSLQKNLNKDQENSIKYWAAGGTLRWNEILRGLVAKYNLPPKSNSDTSYPIPNANNPLAYPLFPFTKLNITAGRLTMWIQRLLPNSSIKLPCPLIHLRQLFLLV